MPRKTDISKLPSKFERVIECKQGAVRSVRFNGELFVFSLMSMLQVGIGQY